MKRILPDGKGGVVLAEISSPELFENSVLCRTTHSLISSGTERGIIRACVGKSVEEMLREGTQLGYTGAGVVEKANGEAVQNFKQGQRVAFYGGPYVSHSEFVVVPKRLLVPLPESVPSEQGVFLGMGAIALHGFRQGRAGLGDVCWVAGAGLIGNLCAQLASISGCRVVVSDPDDSRLQKLRDCQGGGDDFSCVAPDAVEPTVRKASDGRGADAIFLCMSTPSAGPMEQAMRLVRPGGRIVILGVLDIRISREEFFCKEAEVTISRAAGPGRYDTDYEKKGIDYPVQYVRWTEGRNLAEVLRLIELDRLKVASLIFQRVSLKDVCGVYRELIEGKPKLGYLIQWNK